MPIDQARTMRAIPDTSKMILSDRCNRELIHSMSFQIDRRTHILSRSSKEPQLDRIMTSITFINLHKSPELARQARLIGASSLPNLLCPLSQFGVPFLLIQGWSCRNLLLRYRSEALL